MVQNLYFSLPTEVKMIIGEEREKIFKKRCELFDEKFKKQIKFWGIGIYDNETRQHYGFLCIAFNRPRFCNCLPKYLRYI